MHTGAGTGRGLAEADRADDRTFARARRDAWSAPVPAVVSLATPAPPSAVWRVLSDGWTYAGWVVGACRIRAVAPDWPARGAVLEHSVGGWPLTLDDQTISHGREGDTLRLEARGQLVGRALVELTVHPEGTGARVVIAEEALTAAARVVPGPLRRALLVARNRETLRRLVLLAEQRAVAPAR